MFAALVEEPSWEAEVLLPPPAAEVGVVPVVCGGVVDAVEDEGEDVEEASLDLARSSLCNLSLSGEWTTSTSTPKSSLWVSLYLTALASSLSRASRFRSFRFFSSSLSLSFSFSSFLLPPALREGLLCLRPPASLRSSSTLLSSPSWW